MSLHNVDHCIDFTHRLSLQPIYGGVPALFAEVIGNFEPVFYGEDRLVQESLNNPFYHDSGRSYRRVIEDFRIKKKSSD